MEIQNSKNQNTIPPLQHFYYVFALKRICLMIQLQAKHFYQTILFVSSYLHLKVRHTEV